MEGVRLCKDGMMPGFFCQRRWDFCGLEELYSQFPPVEDTEHLC